jgi:hypothetical protein
MSQGVTFSTKEGEKQVVKGDTILIALPADPDTELNRALQEKIPEIFCIGDYKRPRHIIDANGDNYQIGMTL